MNILSVSPAIAVRSFPTIITEVIVQCREGHCVKLKVFTKQGMFQKLVHGDKVLFESNDYNKLSNTIIKSI